MATILSAQTAGAGGAALTGDSSGILQLASNNGVTALSISTSQIVTLTNALPISSGGTGTTTPSLVAGSNVTISGSWPNQTINVNGPLIPNINTIVTSATITPNTVSCSQYNVTALAVNATIAAPTGTLYDGQKLTIRIKDDGTARALTWNAAYRVVGSTLPTTTNASGILYVGCIYNLQDSIWDVVAVAQL